VPVVAPRPAPAVRRRATALCSCPSRWPVAASLSSVGRPVPARFGAGTSWRMGSKRGGVGALRYVRSSDHAHWHLLPFERYELRLPGAAASALRHAKTGFCLGDRYDAKRNLEGKPRKKVSAVGAGCDLPTSAACVRSFPSATATTTTRPSRDSTWSSLGSRRAGTYSSTESTESDGCWRATARTMKPHVSCGSYGAGGRRGSRR
jgi:hypothetical protein